MSSIQPAHAIAAIVGVACFLIYLAPAPDGWPPLAWQGLAVIMFPVVLWATGVVPEYLPALVLFFLAAVTDIASTGVIFSGFRSQAAWLVFAGIVIGQAVQTTGLARRFVDVAARRFTGGYTQLVTGLAFTAFASAFLVPSAMGRAVLLTPIAVAIAERFGHDRNSPRYAGIVLATVLGSTLPAFAILPANVPNLVMTGAAEQIYGIEFSYSEYALLNLPVLGLASVFLSCIFIVVFFNNGDTGSAPSRSEQPAPERGQRILGFILITTVALWLTDTLHDISPAWVALGAALACLFPGIGVLKADEFVKTVNLGPWLFVTGIVGLGAIAAAVGIDDLAASHLDTLVPAGGFGAYLAIVFLGVGASVLTNHPAAPALVTPLAGPLADITGWSLPSVLYAQVPGWVVFPFAHQVPPIVVALSLANIPVRRVTVFFLGY
ncbi:MAG: hypothetical protein DWQ08_06120, partial [Proteobacteria bacterium]